MPQWTRGTDPQSGYPLLSTAINGGLFHPNCRHTMSTFFEDVNEVPPPILPIEKDENGVIINTEGVLLNRIERGDLTLQLNPEKQAPHMKATKERGKSYFTISFDELQKIIYDKHGTGKIHISESNGQIKETIELDKIIGYDLEKETNKGSRTNRFTIHYARKRTHAVPSRCYLNCRKADN